MLQDGADHILVWSEKKQVRFTSHAQIEHKILGQRRLQKKKEWKIIE